MENNWGKSDPSLAGVLPTPNKKPRNRRGGSVAEPGFRFWGKDQAGRASMLATILRTWEALLARGFKMARLLAKEPHLMT